MTNFDVILEYGQQDKDVVINVISRHMVKICEKIVHELCIEQDGYNSIEISNFDRAYMESEFKDFFRREKK